MPSARRALLASILSSLVGCTAPGDSRAQALPPHASAPAAPAARLASALPTSPPPAPPPAACPRDAAPLAEEALRRDVALLASPELDGRAPGSAGDAAARAYLAERLRCFGLTPAGDGGGFEQRFALPGPAAPGGAPATTANLIAYLPGTGVRAHAVRDEGVRGSGVRDEGVAATGGALADEELASQIVLVIAHHDHLGDGHLGANDNASGLAALLAVAQAAAARGGHARTLAFAAFAAEELGLVGSSHYLSHPPAALPLERVVQVVNLDMIGSYSSRKRVHVFGAFAGWPATRLLHRLADRAPRTRFALGGHSVRGDHLGFCQLGIPYAFFWTPDARCYHQRCDTAERVDYPHLTDIAEVASALVQQLGDAPDDLAAARARRGCAPR